MITVRIRVRVRVRVRIRVRVRFRVRVRVRVKDVALVDSSNILVSWSVRAWPEHNNNNSLVIVL